MKIVAGLVAVIVGLFLAWRFVVPALFVALGRGPVDTQTLSVVRVSVSSQVTDSERGVLTSGTGYKFVNVDCRISASPTAVDIYDFQLVKDGASSLGSEQNVGDNLDPDYFFWSFLDSSGAVVNEIGHDVTDFAVRLTFKVPSEASRGYLFYWGEYFGPIEFPERSGS
jgi:hypothetical protein